jgi:hypothetical protein
MGSSIFGKVFSEIRNFVGEVGDGLSFYGGRKYGRVSE